MVTGYVAIWKGIVCVLPLTAIRGEWWNTAYNQQEVQTSTYQGQPVRYNVIHYTIGTEYD